MKECSFIVVHSTDAFSRDCVRKSWCHCPQWDSSDLLDDDHMREREMAFLTGLRLAKRRRISWSIVSGKRVSFGLADGCWGKWSKTTEENVDVWNCYLCLFLRWSHRWRWSGLNQTDEKREIVSIVALDLCLSVCRSMFEDKTQALWMFVSVWFDHNRRKISKEVNLCVEQRRIECLCLFQNEI